MRSEAGCWERARRLNFHAKVAAGFISFGPIAIPIVAATILSVLVEYLLCCRLARGPGSAGNGEDYAGIVADADLEHSPLPCTRRGGQKGTGSIFARARITWTRVSD